MVAALVKVMVLVLSILGGPASLCRRFNSAANLLSDSTESPAICTLIRFLVSLVRSSVQVIADGKLSSHSCQANTIFAACSTGPLQVPANLATRLTAVVLKLNFVTTPKLPLPPPRNAQNRSGFSLSLA